MCTGLEVLPMLLGAGGGLVSAYGANQQARQQDKIAAQGIRSQAARQREADALVNQTIRQQEQSSPEGYRQSALDQYMEQLRRTSGAATTGLNPAGAVSNRFLSAAQAAAGDITDYGTDRAGILSRIDAPDRQRQAEGIAFGRLGSDLNPIRMGSQSDEYLTRLRMNSVRQSPWLGVLSGVLGSASTMDFGGGSTAPTTYGGQAGGMSGGFENNPVNLGRGGWTGGGLPGY